MEGKKSNK